MERDKLPAGFITSVEQLLGDRTEDFLISMNEEPTVSIRLNTRKCNNPALLGYEGLEPVKWCNSGYYLPVRPNFTLNPLLHAGAFYVQDASSMIYETIVRRLAERPDFPDRPSVLDLCAAPGGKTTAMINALPDGSLIIANEVMPQRCRILKENLVKWGYPEITVTSSPTSRFGAISESFDIVAVDAPCSGEGMMRKDAGAVSQWGAGLVARCAALQREILADAVSTLKPGGFLIYSTCTFNRKENEDNLAWLIEELGMDALDMEFPEEWGIGNAIDSNYPALRFMPHLTRGEGLFATVLQKRGERRPISTRNLAETVRKKMKVVLDGIPTVTTKGKVELPSSEWALSMNFPRGRYPEIELDLETALSYLRHEAIQLPPDADRGFTVVCFKGMPLGFVKNIGNRANNLYPAEWRIRFA